MRLTTFLDEHGDVERALTFVNRSQPEQLRSMLEGAFERQPVQVEESTAEEYPENTVLLLDEEGEVLAQSPLSEMSDSLPFINSNAYITGTTTLEGAALPDVLIGLKHVRSACVATRNRTRRSSSLSRSPATSSGSPGAATPAPFVPRPRNSRASATRWAPSGSTAGSATAASTCTFTTGSGEESLEAMGLTVHAGEMADYPDSWFVVHRPPDIESADGVALLAIQDEAGV